MHGGEAEGPQQPAERAVAEDEEDNYYSSVDEQALDMADPRPRPAVVAPVVVSCLSGPVYVRKKTIPTV